MSSPGSRLPGPRAARRPGGARGGVPSAAFLAFLLAHSTVSGEEIRWYLSNSAGMALERLYSRSAVLRNRYGLSVESLSPAGIPGPLRPYYELSWRVELRTLYEEGRESRLQYLFIDPEGRTRLLGVLRSGGPGDGEPVPPGFIEFYDEDRLLTGARQLMEDGSEYVLSYIYRDGVLVRAETGFREPEGTGIRPVSADYYRYTRSASLRAVERVYYREEGEEPESSRFNFPPLSPGAPVEQDFVRPTLAYGSSFFEDLLRDGASRVMYTTDERGRVLIETRRNEAGELLAELHNTWAGDRLAAVEWRSGEDVRRIEYDYDGGGNRIEERNYNRGLLERVVRRQGDREVEELYMNGVLALRALWEGGRKVSEERIRPPSPLETGSGEFSPAGEFFPAGEALPPGEERR